MPPTIIFGDVRGLNLEEIKPILQKYGISRLDSAAIYENGESERRLGQAQMSREFVIDTKIMGGPLDAGMLSPEKVGESSRLSLERLQMDKVNVLYCHLPDIKTPLRDQARGLNDIRERFTHLGLSNCSPEVVEQWLQIAKDEGYVRPTWFQGQYNLVCRVYEKKLFPLLRKEGILFAAYSPLAGGFLNGNLKPNKVTGVRFVSHSATKLSLGFWDRPEMYETFEKLEQISEKTALGTDELSLRWLRYHSQLTDDDVIILGASKVSQIEQSLQNLHKGPLEQHVVDELNDLWTKEVKVANEEIVNPQHWKFG